MRPRTDWNDERNELSERKKVTYLKKDKGI